MGKVKVCGRCKKSHLDYILPVLKKADLSITELVCSVVRVFYGFCIENEITEKSSPLEITRAFNKFFRCQIDLEIEKEMELEDYVF